MNDIGYTAKHPVKATKTTFQIIRALIQLNGGRITELSDHLGLPKSNVHNYLSTLLEEGYVIKREQKYHISLRFLEIGAFARNQQELFHIARSEVSDLAKRTGERINLAVPENGMVVYIYHDSGDEGIELDAYTGRRYLMHCTGLGKAILAHYDQDSVNEILDTHGMPARTENTITDRDELFTELREVREKGVAFDREERYNGLRCVAVPIVNNRTGSVEGAISVSAPKSRLKGEELEENFPTVLKDSVNVIELNVNYS